jgi:hypothetical protein
VASEIINWLQEELQRLDKESRKMLTIHEQHHPRPDVRLYMFPIKREEEN